MPKLEFNTVEHSVSRRTERLNSLTDKRSITRETRKDDQTQFGKSLVIKTDTKTETVAGDKIEWLTDDIYEKIDNSIVDTTKITKTENGYFKKEVVNTYVTTDVGASLFKMPYSNDTQKVIRLGIDSETDEIKEFVEYFNKTERDKYEGSAGSKQSLKLAEIQKLITTAQNYISDIEKKLVIHAKNYLVESGNSAILVDIFAREANGNIKSENGVPETHTVVLYKQENKYLVIDPSNASFSTILSGVENVVCCFDKNMQIYKPAGETGQDSWRDCIDIAVKLAFGLQDESCDITLSKINNYSYIKKSDIQSSFTIKNITNQQQMYSSLPKEIKDFVCRIKQSSDVVKSKVSTLFFKVLKQMHLNKSNELEQTKIDPIYTQKEYDKVYSDALKGYTLDQLDKTTVLTVFKTLVDSFKLTSNSNNIEKFYIEELGNIDSNLTED